MKYITAALVALFPLILSAQTYTNEVATIINDNCVVCHRSGGIGPMGFETYEQVRPWAPLISLKEINLLSTDFNSKLTAFFPKSQTGVFNKVIIYYNYYNFILQQFYDL